MSSVDLAYLPMHVAAARLRKGELSPVDLDGNVLGSDY